MRFRPCIDLHQGQVKQIVGSTLRDGAVPETNFVAEKSSAHFAELYRRDNLPGGHVIMLGPNNKEAAQQALAAFPCGLQLGGGINACNAPQWIERGAAQVIVTSYAFRDGRLHHDNLQRVGRSSPCASAYARGLYAPAQHQHGSRPPVAERAHGARDPGAPPTQELR